MYKSELVDTVVTHANMKGFELTPLFGDSRGYMPPQLKTKNKSFRIRELKIAVKVHIYMLTGELRLEEGCMVNLVSSASEH